MGNKSSKVKGKQGEKTVLVDPDNNNINNNDPPPSSSSPTPQKTSQPTTYGTVGQDPYDGHGHPQVPPVEGLGFCERILLTLSHRTTVLIVGVAFGILFLGLDSRFNGTLYSYPQTSKVTIILVTFATYLATALLVSGGIFGCLRAHKITWWKALAPGLILQILLLVYYVHNSHTDVIDGYTSDLHVPNNITDDLG